MRITTGLLITSLLATALPASAQCLVDRALNSGSGSEFGDQLGLSSGWLAIGSRDAIAGRYDVQLFSESPDDRWTLSQTVSVPATGTTDHALALDEGRLFVSFDETVRGFRLQGSSWGLVGADVTASFDVHRMALAGNALSIANESYSPSGDSMSGEAEFYEVLLDGSLSIVDSIGGTLHESLGTSLSATDAVGGGFSVSFALGAPGDGLVHLDPGYVLIAQVLFDVIVPGTNLTPVASLTDPRAPSGADRFGTEVAISGNRIAVQSGLGNGRVEIFDQPLFGGWSNTATLLPEVGQSSFGDRLALSGDNLIVSTHDSAAGSTRLLLFQHNQGQWTQAGSFDEPEQAATTGGISIDGPRLATSSASFDSPLDGDGAAWVWATEETGCKGLVTSPSSASLSAGSVVELLSSFAPGAAGEVFLVLGSLSGTAPGVPLGLQTLPLVPDAWTTLTLTAPNLPPLSNTLSSLDASGGAVSSLTLPSETAPALAGSTLHHATVTFDPTTGAVTRVSAPSALDLRH
ncbi:MAG: hypothetical protein AAFZ65_10665 [Planctomycetota bacterium]